MPGVTAVRRKGFGLADIIIAAIVLIEIMIMLYLGADFAGAVAERSADRSVFFHGEHAVGEVIQAPCATVSRGVFSVGAVQSGNLDCIDPLDGVLVTFEGGSVSETWRVEQTESGVQVQESSESTNYPETYRILLYSGATESTVPAELTIGPVPRDQNPYFYGADSPAGGFLAP